MFFTVTLDILFPRELAVNDVLLSHSGVWKSLTSSSVIEVHWRVHVSTKQKDSYRTEHPTICSDGAQTSKCTLWFKPQPLTAIFSRRYLQNYASLDMHQMWAQWAEGDSSGIKNVVCGTSCLLCL